MRSTQLTKHARAKLKKHSLVTSQNIIGEKDIFKWKYFPPAFLQG